MGTYESGSRLRAHVLDGGQGATVLVDWWDSELQVACAFAMAEDDSMRCFPHVSTVNFLDEVCTQPVAVLQEGYPLPDYVVQDLSPCLTDDPRPAPFVVRDPVDVTTYYTRDFYLGTCNAVEAATTEIVFALDPIPVAEFARAEVVTERRGDRLDVDVLVGEDGSRSLGRVVDRSLGEPCGFQWMEGRCVPRAGAFLGGYSDAACTDPVGLYCEGAGCAAPRYVHTSFSACGQPTEHSFWTLGEVLQSVFSDASGTCEVADTYGAACPFVELGASVDPAIFPETGSAMLGEGRLRAPLVTATDGSVAGSAFVWGDDTAAFWDDQVASFCSVLELASAKRVCVSGTANGLSTVDWIAYSDPECTRGLVAATSCEAPRYAIADDEPGDQLYEGGLHVYAVVGPQPGDTAYVVTEAGCEARSFAGELWIVGDEVAPEEAFPRVDDRIE